MNPPYLQIAEALRDRIVSGSLRPGQLVPSTRKIVAEWGVAMATATKALAELRSRGLVEVVPGVGTVVSVTSTDVTEPAVLQFTRRALIVRCAMRIADTEGIAAVSMRRIAAELDLAPMSLYRHVVNKEELFLLMRDAAFGDITLPDVPEGTWRQQLEVSMAALWSVYRRHPWLARTSSLTRPYAGPNQLRYSEWNLRVLSELGLSPDRVFVLHIALFNLVHGTAASLETEAYEQAETGMDQDRWMRRHHDRGTALIESGPYPYSAKVFLGATGDFDLDVLFTTALATMLDGISRLVEGGSGDPTGR
ncbi:GntR family transcriptional regulator [Rhodococcus sp. HNM0563]|uniref:TetR/AcrR family transcriptional regulator C-terminal domain-containing protein n=1 Tax=Rhodococcus sp. HNM0563 TaxID=2716339 RepID=UPI00146F2905|nr:GntR family transcriptional regulator [Rhodococcus sp. HNM0563]NLU63709.1 GntR family transcriptional regulator [Rhodococcus sp. HNM0563]